MKVTEAIIWRAGRLDAQQQAGKRGRNDAGLAGPAHEQQSRWKLQRARRSGQRAEEHRHRPCHQHQDGDDSDAAEPVSADQGEIDLGAEQDENEQPHDERGGQHIFVELLRLAGLHPEAERFLVAEHDAEHKDRHEAAGLQAVGGEIGADHRDQRHDRARIRRGRPISHGRSESAARYPSAMPATIPMTDCLSRSKIAPITENSPLPIATASTLKVRIAAIGVVERGLADDGLRHPIANPDLTKDRHQRRRIGRGDGRAQQQRHDRRSAENGVGGKRDDAGGDQYADGGDDDDGDPDLLQDLYSQRSAAVEQNVAGAEQQDDLVQRRIRLDLDRGPAPAGRSRCRRPETPRHRESRIFCASSAATVPIARIRPHDSSVCLAISMEADVSNGLLPAGRATA